MTFITHTLQYHILALSLYKTLWTVTWASIGQEIYTVLSERSYKYRVHPRTGLEGPEVVQVWSDSFFNLGARRGWWSPPRLVHFAAGNDPVPIVQEAGWAPRPLRTGANNLAATSIRSPDRPARDVSLCRLNYPGLRSNNYCTK
jgi:hypothetical protein